VLLLGELAWFQTLRTCRLELFPLVYVFIYCLFNDALIGSEYKGSNDGMAYK
jgi:hypothetical protein